MAPKATTRLRRFAKFCSTLTLPNGEAMKFEPFQRKMLGDYFAGVLELVIVIPKKNGKTSLLAALALFHLMEDQDNADCVVVANSRDQAMKLFDEAKGFVDRHPEMRQWLKVLRGYREIRKRTDLETTSPKDFAGMIRVLAADADTADGWGGTLALVDELHRAKDEALSGVLRDGLGPRAGQMITISTAGDTYDSPLGSIRRTVYADPLKVKVETGRNRFHRYYTTGRFSWHEWALEPDDDRDDLKTVKLANPASWQTITQLAARKESPTMTPAQWARFACGVWGLGGEPAFDRAVWDSLETDRTVREGARVTIGFDGARRKDGTALVGCELSTGHLFTLGYWQAPPNSDDDWEVPESEVTEVVDYAMERYDVALCYCDPAWWESTVDKWAGDHGERTVVRWWTNRIKSTALACRAFRNDMHGERMSHDGDPKLAEHVANAGRHETRMREDDEMLWVIRKDSRDSPRKIDLAMAAVLAWRARLDAIAKGAMSESEHGAYQW